MRRIILIALISLLLLTYTTLGQTTYSLTDAEGDVTILNIDPEHAKGVDILGASIKYSSEAEMLVITIQLAAPPQESGIYGYNVVLHFYRTDGGESIYTVTLRIVNGEKAFSQILLEAPEGTYRNLQVKYMVEGNTLRIYAPLPSYLNPDNIKASEIQLVVESRTFTVGGEGMAEDLASTYITSNPSQGGEGETPTYTQTPTMTETTTSEYEYTRTPFRDNPSQAPGVTVSIKGTPTIEVSESRVNGIPVVILRVNVEGESQGASHIALAFEIFINGELDSQTFYNTVSFNGAVDSDGPVNGYEMTLTLPVSNQVPYKVEEKLKPVGGDWSSWVFQGEYKIPGTASQFKNLLNMIEAIKGGDAEVYVTAIAFKSSNEAEYTTATKKADIEIQGESIGGAPTKTGTQTTPEQAEQETETTHQEGGTIIIMLAGVAAVIAVVVYLVKLR